MESKGDLRTYLKAVRDGQKAALKVAKERQKTTQKALKGEIRALEKQISNAVYELKLLSNRGKLELILNDPDLIGTLEPAAVASFGGASTMASLLYGVRPHDPANLEAVHLRQHEIQHQQIGGAAPNAFERVVARRHMVCRIACLLQVADDEFGDLDAGVLVPGGAHGNSPE